MLERAQAVGAVYRAANLHEEHFREVGAWVAQQLPKSKAAVAAAAAISPSRSQPEPPRPPCPPLFEGDYWLEETSRLFHILRRRPTMDPNGGQGAPNTPWQLCVTMLRTLMHHPMATPFNVPVDPVAMRAPRYFEIITSPMDLGTVNKKLKSGGYTYLAEVKREVEQVFINAKTYNPEAHQVMMMMPSISISILIDYRLLQVHQMALALEKVYRRELRAVVGKCLSGEGTAPPLLSACSSSSSLLSKDAPSVEEEPPQGEDEPELDVELLGRIRLGESLVTIPTTLAQGLAPSEETDPEVTAEAPRTGSWVFSRQLVAEVSRSVERMRDDLLVLHLQPPDNQQAADSAFQLPKRCRAYFSGMGVKFGDTTDPVSSNGGQGNVCRRPWDTPL
jgi:hypothetical protein